jgi:hypothetical protein
LCLVGSTNNSNDAKIPSQESHDISTNRFNAQQPLGEITGFFDRNGSLVRPCKPLHRFGFKKRSKYIAFGYKICAKSSVYSTTKTRILSINEMVLVKLGFTSSDLFNMYSRDGKIRASGADVVAMASIVPVVQNNSHCIKLVCDVRKARSVFLSSFVYYLGGRVDISYFQTAPDPKCGRGIHFFWNPMKALTYRHSSLGQYFIKNLEKFAAITFSNNDQCYHIDPCNESEAASLIQFFWRLCKARKRFHKDHPVETNPNSLLNDIIQYWKGLVQQHQKSKSNATTE